ncbi:MAG TPA: hypothetical protein VFE78_11355 [Gemmataceae bacterium]|jgi:hypothetical protein|nr:hypothetical protein [Gemmataceae bacterium]
MGKTMALVLACLVPLSAAPRGADGPNGMLPGGCVRDGAPSQQTVQVEMVGKLRCVVTQWHTGKILFVTDTIPANPSRSWALYTGLTIDGRTYLLDAGGNKTLAGKMAPRAELLGQWAEVRGKLLKGDRVTVAGFNLSLEK